MRVTFSGINLHQIHSNRLFRRTISYLKKLGKLVEGVIHYQILT